MSEVQRDAAAGDAGHAGREAAVLFLVAEDEVVVLHLAVGVPPMLRMNGDLLPIKFRNLAEAATPGLSGSTEPGFLAWVIGGSNATGVAADWLTSAWGQNAAMFPK